MTFLEAARLILAESDGPLTASEIVQRALGRGLVTTTGKTPGASLAAALYAEANRAEGATVVRVFEPGPNRARRKSVRWMLREGAEPVPETNSVTSAHEVHRDTSPVAG